MSDAANISNKNNKNKRVHRDTSSTTQQASHVTQPSVDSQQHVNFDTDVTKLNDSYSKWQCTSTSVNSATTQTSSPTHPNSLATQQQPTSRLQHQNIYMLHNLQKRNKSLRQNAQIMLQRHVEISSNKYNSNSSSYTATTNRSTNEHNTLTSYTENNNTTSSHLTSSSENNNTTSSHYLHNLETSSQDNNNNEQYMSQSSAFEMDLSQDSESYLDNEQQLYSHHNASLGTTTNTNNNVNNNIMWRNTSTQTYMTSAQANLDFTEQYCMDSLMKFLTHQQRSGYLNNDKYYLTSEQKAGLELSQLLDCNGIPKYLFDDIMHWAATNIIKIPYKYNKMLTEMTEKMNYHSFFAKSETIELDINGELIEIVYFNFLAQVFSLLTDNELMHPDNLLFGNNPNKYYDIDNSMEDNIRGDVDCCQWYFDTVKLLTKNESNHLVCGVIFFIDETYFDGKGVKRVEPVSFTLSIFKRHVRYNPKAWRHLGFIPKGRNRRPNGVAMSDMSRLKVMDYHKCLSKILNTFKEAQQKGPYKWKFDHCNETYNLHFPLMFIAGDMLGHNKLCGRYSNFINTHSLLRDCNILSKDAHICDYECTHIKYEHIRELIIDSVRNDNNEIKERAKSELKLKSYHYGINNAFNGICFGSNTHGITGATPPELLHMFKLKFVDDVYSKYMLLLGAEDSDTVAKVRYNSLICEMVSNTYRQSDRSFPDISIYKDGMRKQAIYTADDKFTRLFVLYLYSLTSASLAVISDVAPSTQPKYKNDLLRKHKQFIKLIEDTMIMYLWLYQSEFPKKLCKPAEKGKFVALGSNKISIYKRFYQEVLYDKAEECSFPKFHSLDHMLLYIYHYGSSRNFDGGPCESGLKYNVKLPGKQTRGNSKLLIKQLAKTYTEIQMLRKASDTATCLSYNNLVSNVLTSNSGSYNNNTINNTINSIAQENTNTSSYYLDKDKQSIIWKKSNVSPRNPFDDMLLGFVFKKLFDINKGITQNCSIVEGFTTMRHNGDLLHAHPSFKNGMSWNDYAYVKYEGFDKMYLCRIEMFLNLTNTSLKDEYKELNEVCAVVKSVFADKNGNPSQEALAAQRKRNFSRNKKLELCQFWTMEEDWWIIPVTSIDGPGYVLKDINHYNDMQTNQFVIEIKPYNTWCKMWN